MKAVLGLLAAALLATPPAGAGAQQGSLRVPPRIAAGDAFSIESTGGGRATVYIVGPGAVLRRDLGAGETLRLPAGTLPNAGRYAVILDRDGGDRDGGGDSRSYPLEVTAARQPAALSFLARPSRLPVNLAGGITGAAYVFDTYGNLITAPMTISFALSTPGGDTERVAVAARSGAGWTRLNSSGRQGSDQFVAQAGGISSARVIRQVPGDPCSLRMSVRPAAGDDLDLITDPVRDCSGNAVPDGTIVTFTAVYPGGQSTVDVPLKRGVAEVRMPRHSGATISVASGVVLGNQIRGER